MAAALPGGLSQSDFPGGRWCDLKRQILWGSIAGAPFVQVLDQLVHTRTVGRPGVEDCPAILQNGGARDSVLRDDPELTASGRFLPRERDGDPLTPLVRTRIDHNVNLD